jgi:nicotinamidase-related amidase
MSTLPTWSTFLQPFGDLEFVLSARSITRILVADIATNVCVESTVRSAAGTR